MLHKGNSLRLPAPHLLNPLCLEYKWLYASHCPENTAGYTSMGQNLMKEKKQRFQRSGIENSGHSASCHREPQSQPAVTAAWLPSSMRHNIPAKCAIVFVPCHTPFFYQSEEWPHQLQPVLSTELAAPELRNRLSHLSVPSVLWKGETGSK